jgi:plasmid stabilization system protein ParE
MRSLQINEKAKVDLAEIKIHFRNVFAENIFDRINNNIIKRSATLCEFPEVGVKPKLRKIRKNPLFANYRYTIEMSYLVFYTFDDTTVYIERILDGRRDYAQLL